MQVLQVVVKTEEAPNAVLGWDCSGQGRFPIGSAI